MSGAKAGGGAARGAIRDAAVPAKGGGPRRRGPAQTVRGGVPDVAKPCEA